VKARRIAAAIFSTIALCSCAAVIGLDHVGYEDANGEAGAAADAGPEASDLDAKGACTGTVCGARCCGKDAGCIDSGVCSNDVVDVSGGGNGSCAVVADGTVWCWGENSVGQVGVGDAGDDTCTFINQGLALPDACRFRATKVAALPSGMTRVSAGFQMACAIHGPDGTVWCWGQNEFGALGHDSTTDPRCPELLLVATDGGIPTTPCQAIPSQVPGLTGVAELAVAEYTSCARTSSGAVLCWGAGSSGQLGDDAGANSVIPVNVRGLPSDVVQLATGIYAGGSCAVASDGSAWCWGSTPPPEPGTLTAHRIITGGAILLPAFAEIHFGNEGYCARTMDRSVLCWGANDGAQLGQGGCDNDAGHAPVPVVGLPAAVALDSRWLHSCALDDLGVVHCWGVAQDGALGRGDIRGDSKCGVLTSSGTPTAVPGLPRITRIATGIETTFAVDVDGRLWAWGGNDTARIGHVPKANHDLLNCGDPSNQTVCNPTPMLVEGLP
jgi:alpha-tubulin suppressor-like RCC1 family protein